MIDDQAIIAQVLSGDTDAFRALVERYQAPVIRLIANLTNDRAGAEDLAQEVFLAAYRHLARYDPARSAFATWLFTIARNRALNAARKRCVETSELHADELDRRAPGDDLADDDLHRALDAALAALPEDQRSVFVLAEIEELPYETIAQIEQVPIGTVRSRIHRAKTKLRELLREIQEAGL